MTDSESELCNSNVFTFQNVNTTVSARGPYTNISNFSYRNQLTSGMYNMPRNFERQRYAESLSDHRSIYYRRESSPMSIYSAYDIQPRNFQQCYNGMSSQRSVCSGRSGTPSIDSTASVSAADIAFAFKNVKYNKYDLKVIKEAYQKLMKQRHRKRIEKRRNKRMFLKGCGNLSRDDSGDQASDSSISSDDCRSVKTYNKENMSSGGMTRVNNMLKDSTDSFRQNTFKNIFSVRANSNIKTSKNFENNSLSNNYMILSQKERFKTGFVLPSQRFNKLLASTIIPRNIDRNRTSCESNYKQNNKCMENSGSLSGSEEEIFPGTARSNTVCNKKVVQKRSLDSEEDSNFPDRKRSKRSSTNIITKSCECGPKNSADSHNFEFAKPTLPVRKSKFKMQEKIISKSKQPITEFVELNSKEIFNKVEKPQPLLSSEEPSTSQPQIVKSKSSQDCNVSICPSFIKRKLFTQKLDVAEKTNLSSDAISSPQSLYSAFQHEKNKTRKLVPTQSCMNREVQGDNNLLALIHKIVPPDSINKSSQIKMDANNSNKQDDEDTWDVTSVISMCNENDASDTFTDEEICNGDDKNKDKSKITKNANHHPKTRNRNIINPKSLKNVNSNVSVHHVSRKVINKTDKKTVKKTKSTNSRPNTRSNSKTKDKPKPVNSIDKNINSPQLFNINTNKTNKHKSKKVNNINPYRITRNNSFIQLKQTRSINRSFNSTQDEAKINNSNSRPQTRSNSILKVSNSLHENMNTPCNHRIATNRRDKEKTKLTNNLTPHRITRSNSNLKIKETKSMDEKKNVPEDKGKSKKNNSISYRQKTRNSNLKTKAIKNVEENLNVFKECRALISKMPTGRVALKPRIHQNTNSLHNTSITKNMVQRSAKTFWDTDFESDAEYQGTPQRNLVK